jgi:hypothetical protein
VSDRDVSLVGLDRDVSLVGLDRDVSLVWLDREDSEMRGSVSKPAFTVSVFDVFAIDTEAPAVKSDRSTVAHSMSDTRYLDEFFIKL